MPRFGPLVSAVDLPEILLSCISDPRHKDGSLPRTILPLMKASVLVSYLRRTLDLAVLDLGVIPHGPLVGWVLVQKGKITQDGSSAGFAELVSAPALASCENSTLLLSINPFADDQTLASFCKDRNILDYYIATDLESTVRLAALHLNRRYLIWRYEERPYVILKWAETADGFIARSDYQPSWISNTQSRQLVHQWRSQEAAIWAGKNTYYHDNPRLNVRDWGGRDPIRVVIDSTLQLNRQLHVFDQSQPTLCYNNVRSEVLPNLELVLLRKNSSWNDRIQSVFDDLHQRQIQSVLVEGGSTLLSFLLEKGWWDEARVFRAPITFEEGVAAPKISQNYMDGLLRVGDNTLTIYRRKSIKS